MSQTVTYATGNALKIEIASSILADYGVKVEAKKLDLPEIQSVDGKEVCEFAAVHAAKLLNCTVVKTDVSYSIPSLNGFPGPFVKYINQWLSPNDICLLMQDKEDRSVVIVDFLTIANPNGEIQTFKSSTQATLTDTPDIKSIKGSTFDRLLIRQGYSLPQSMLTPEDLDKIFRRDVEVWHQLGKYLKGL